MSILTGAETMALLQAHDRIASRWGLSAIDAARLLGTDADTLLSWHTGVVPVPEDALACLGSLLGVYRELVCMFDDRARGMDWVLKASTDFRGRSAVDVMLEGGLPGILQVQGYLAGLNGIW